jgi:hypothetical protein
LPEGNFPIKYYATYITIEIQEFCTQIGEEILKVIKEKSKE